MYYNTGGYYWNYILLKLLKGCCDHENERLTWKQKLLRKEGGWEREGKQGQKWTLRGIVWKLIKYLMNKGEAWWIWLYKLIDEIIQGDHRISSVMIGVINGIDGKGGRRRGEMGRV